MTLTKDQMKRLSAYVDGELDPQQQSDVAREVAENPAAARAVASMSALKVGIKNAFTTNEGQIDLDHTGGEPRAPCKDCGINCSSCRTWRNGLDLCHQVEWRR